VVAVLIATTGIDVLDTYREKKIENGKKGRKEGTFMIKTWALFLLLFF
jgi:hypothetical protein